MSSVGEAGRGRASQRQLGVVILGSSAYPHYPKSLNLDNESFARSAAAFRALITDENVCLFGKPAVLDLFDVDDDPSGIIRKIREFLRNQPPLTDILLYYCGHGAFLRDRTYYLTLKQTEPENEAFTGLPFRQMRLALETLLMSKRVYLVLDCCFSGQSAKEWMATGIGHVIEDDVLRSFPREGTALIAASAGGKPAIAPEGQRLTMFTGALIDAISTGIAGDKKELSFRDIIDRVRARISERYGSAGAAPEIHAPRQDEGDITFMPFFVNKAFLGAKETGSERETFELALADLDGPLLRRREAAVETLSDLLSNTQSGAFRREILEKFKIALQQNDSQRVRLKCAEILERWSESNAERTEPQSEEKREKNEKKGRRRPILLAAGGLVLCAALSVPVARYISQINTPPVPDPNAVVLPTAIEPTIEPTPGPAVTTAAPAKDGVACEGQTGALIYEDNFSDDEGGWEYDQDFLFSRPGALVKVAASDKGRWLMALNGTFSATQGDFCAAMSFPPEATTLKAGVGLLLLAKNYSNVWLVEAFVSGKVGLYALTDKKWSTIWEGETKNLIKADPASVNFLRAIVKNGTLSVVINGEPLKTVRISPPKGDLKFGLFAEFGTPSPVPISFVARSFRVTEGK